MNRIIDKMPKKPKKTTEEKSAEGYFPVDEEDLKNTTEKLLDSGRI